VNHRRLTRFRNTLQACELNEIPLQNRRFTWNNERLNSTLSKFDAIFCNHDGDIAFSDHILHALSSSLSDHCPLLLACSRGPKNCVPLNSRTFELKCRDSRMWWRNHGVKAYCIGSLAKCFFTSLLEWQSAFELGVPPFLRMPSFIFIWLLR
jgi:hypothetical protein